MAENNRIGIDGTRTTFLGVGGCGSNVIRRISRQAPPEVRFAAVDTDSKSLLLSPAAASLQIGKKAVRGQGAGGDPRLGRKAAEESVAALDDLLKRTDLLFVVAGFGGGTGTGALPVVAEIVHELAIIPLFFVFTPADFEGLRRAHIAREGLERIRALPERARDVMIIPNAELLRKFPPDTPMQTALAGADSFILKGVEDWLKASAEKNNPRLDAGEVRALFAGIEDPIPYSF
ncbi:MAG: hypothetical protein JW929_01350 [Anaerolineales bacterium]|nr:hypothetical protein [Anaerolineales bacterium]